MFSFKLLIATAAFVCVSARHILLEDETNYYLLPIEDLEDVEPSEDLVPIRTGRMRRQVQGSVTAKSDGTSGANVRIPLAGGDQNALSAIGSVNFNKDLKMIGQTAGLELDNIKGHSLMLTHSKLPGADRVTAAGNVNLFHNDNHNFDANAFAARTMPNAAQAPAFNTYGAGAEYMFKNKVGADVNIVRTPHFDQTDYSAGGKLNLFRGRDSSLDFNAGLVKTVSPYIPKSSWEPNLEFTFKKWF